MGGEIVEARSLGLFGVGGKRLTVEGDEAGDVAVASLDDLLGGVAAIVHLAQLVPKRLMRLFGIGAVLDGAADESGGVGSTLRSGLAGLRGQRDAGEQRCNQAERMEPASQQGAESGESWRGKSGRAGRLEGERYHVKALVKSQDAPGLWLEDVSEPQIGINDVKIRVLYTGICGTDLHIHDWDAWARETIQIGLTIGHEFVGEVVDFGANVFDVPLGALVSGEGHVVCGRCRNCLAGRRHLCAHTQGLGVQRNGCFAEYVVLPATNIWQHAPGIEPEVASIFDPFGNAVHTALAFPVLGEDVLVTGAGPIGIMAAAVAKHAGARHVVISDPNPYRRALAEKVGVTRAVDPAATPLAEVQKQLKMVEGFDVGLEMSGNAHAFRDMIANMSHGAKIAMLGIPATEISVDWNRIIFNQITLRGIYGREMYETWYKMTVMLESGLDISPVITHRLHWSEFAQGFDAMRSGNSGKVILDWRDVA